MPQFCPSHSLIKSSAARMVTSPMLAGDGTLAARTRLASDNSAREEVMKAMIACENRTVFTDDIERERLTYIQEIFLTTQHVYKYICTCTWRSRCCGCTSDASRRYARTPLLRRLNVTLPYFRHAAGEFTLPSGIFCQCTVNKTVLYGTCVGDEVVHYIV